ncbi:MAG TPA: alkaline phosphatase PhoX [Polyangiales bacterium]
MRPVNRRGFLRGGAALPLLVRAGRAAAADEPRRELVRDPAGIIDLPRGFSYRILSRSGEPMSDGYRTPGNPDAMGVFTLPGGELALMRNHEITPGDRGHGPLHDGQAQPPEAYDPEGSGGVTRLLLDPQTLTIRRSNLVLTGTHWNCAGGLSPWGWLSCEEIFVPNHGYVFLCPTNADQVATARPIKPYGRFRHEAATVDPATMIAYLTEDMGDAAFYRFLPNDPRAPFEGKLQALAIHDAERFDTSYMQPGQRLAVHWVDVPEADPHDDNVRLQAHAAGAARFARTEGLWLAGADAYICATTGGPIGRGQVFRLHHSPQQEAKLEVVAHASDTSVLDMPDNLTVSPHGHVYVAEDGLEGNFVRRITPGGGVVDFARNALSLSEFAGPCFSPDGKHMFVNIQHDGLTLAISGPFANERDAKPLRSGQMGHSRDTWTTGATGLGSGLAIIALAALARRKRQRAENPAADKPAD